VDVAWKAMQGVPIKIISVTVTDFFFTKFTAFPEVSGHIGSKFRYNIYCGLKITTI